MEGNETFGTKGNQDTPINVTDKTLEKDNLDCRQMRRSFKQRTKKGTPN